MRQVDFIDATSGNEIMTPADSPSVITVGALAPWASKGQIVGPDNQPAIKPDIVMPNTIVRMSNGTQTWGTSNAVFLLAGTLAYLRAQEPRLSMSMVKSLIHSVELPLRMRRVTLDEMGRFQPTMAQALKDAYGDEAPGVFLAPDGSWVLQVRHISMPLRNVFDESVDWKNRDHILEDRYRFFLHTEGIPQAVGMERVMTHGVWVLRPRRVMKKVVRGYAVADTARAMPWQISGNDPDRRQYVELQLERPHRDGELQSTYYEDFRTERKSLGEKLFLALHKRVWNTPNPAELERLVLRGKREKAAR